MLSDRRIDGIGWREGNSEGTCEDTSRSARTFGAVRDLDLMSRDSVRANTKYERREKGRDEE